MVLLGFGVARTHHIQNGRLLSGAAMPHATLCLKSRQQSYYQVNMTVDAQMLLSTYLHLEVAGNTAQVAARYAIQTPCVYVVVYTVPLANDLNTAPCQRLLYQAPGAHTVDAFRYIADRLSLAMHDCGKGRPHFHLLQSKHESSSRVTAVSHTTEQWYSSCH